MAMSVRYQYVDGEILYQSGVDGRIDYLPDALGSVLATTKPDQPEQVDNTYRYKPYGGLLDKTGTGIDPKYLWVGTRTYRDTSFPHASHYMVARHFGEQEGRWTSVDPLWPVESEYRFGIQNPMDLGVSQDALILLQKQRGRPLPDVYPRTSPRVSPDPHGTTLLLRGGLVFVLLSLTSNCPYNRYREFPLPFPTVRPLPKPWSNCKELGHRYESQCKSRPRSCKENETDCNVINQNMRNGENCAKLRIEYLLRCNPNPGKDSTPEQKRCALLAELCKVLAAIAHCDSIGSRLQPPCGADDFGVPDVSRERAKCFEAMKSCKGYGDWPKFV